MNTVEVVLVLPELSEGGYFARNNGTMDNEDLPSSLINILENLVNAINIGLMLTGVPIHWTGLLDWTTGLKIYPQNLVSCTVKTTKSYC